jgi:hypothetical protein
MQPRKDEVAKKKNTPCRDFNVRTTQRFLRDAGLRMLGFSPRFDIVVKLFTQSGCAERQ